MSLDDGSRPPPLFVVGCGRSGTTMLRLMLDAHPDLAIPGESHFITALWADRRRYNGPNGLDVERLVRDVVRSPRFQLWKTPEAIVRRRVRQLERPTFESVMEATFASYAEHRGKTRWGDKTPIYVRSIPLLHRLFPNGRFLHVIRDGRDVALSYLTLPWGPDTIWRSAYKWRRDVSAGRRDGGRLRDGRYAEIRYESLVRDPRTTLEAICAFADLPFDHRMLEYHRDGAQRLEAREVRAKYHASAATPPKSGLRDWRNQMKDRDVVAFESVAGTLLSELGYERRFRDIGARRRAGATIRIAGYDLLGWGSRAKKWSLRFAGAGRPPHPG
jgi:Sulfotransferase family